MSSKFEIQFNNSFSQKNKRQKVLIETNDKPDIEIITAFEERKVDAANQAQNNESLVIPLTNHKSDDSHLVVKKNAPLLMANLAPQLMGITDDNKRFKVDMSLRATDMDFNSDIYETIPVEKFGAAMLRGMGWSGQLDNVANNADDKINPREIRLGLGATSKPPENGNNRNSKHKNKNAEKKELEWNKKVETKIKNQVLNVGEIIWIRNGCDFIGKRGEVLTIKGVAGLDKIRFLLF
jgi:hypothetical protein